MNCPTLHLKDGSRAHGRTERSHAVGMRTKPRLPFLPRLGRVFLMPMPHLAAEKWRLSARDVVLAGDSQIPINVLR